MNVDHVAIEVGDFDERLRFLVEHVGLVQRRVGRLVADPTRRVAMLADEHGVKIELVEGASATEDRMLHLAFDVPSSDAVDESFARLLAVGCRAIAEPRRFEPARSRTATVAHPAGATYQVVTYDPDSTDARGGHA